MGGTISILLREPDGKIIPMLRWTNILPFYLKHPQLFSKDPIEQAKWLIAFKEQWLEMKQDYKTNKFSQKFDHPMTSCYFPDGGKAPVGYGLVYIDLQNKQILSSQGYTHVETLFFYPTQLDEDHIKNIVELKDLGYLTPHSDQVYFKNEAEYYNFKVPGWKIKDYKEDTKGMKYLKQAIIKSGITLNKKEEKHWDKFIKELSENE